MKALTFLNAAWKPNQNLPTVKLISPHYNRSFIVASSSRKWAAFFCLLDNGFFMDVIAVKFLKVLGGNIAMSYD